MHNVVHVMFVRQEGSFGATITGVDPRKPVLNMSTRNTLPGAFP